MGFIRDLLTIYKLKRLAKKPAVDLSLGSKAIQQLKESFLKQQFPALEAAFLRLDSDHRSHALDYITLDDYDLLYQNWSGTGSTSGVLDLFHGMNLLHKAWKIRGHKYAAEVPQENMLLHFEYLREAAPLLEAASSSPEVAETAFERLVRLHRSLSDLEAGEAAFAACTRLNPHNFWAHLEQSETLQPKWRGSLEQIQEFIKGLPSRQVIQYIVHLKLYCDSIGQDEDLFGIKDGKLMERASAYLLKLDQNLSRSPLQSPHRFIIYNYMTILAFHFGDDKMYFRRLAIKYLVLSQGYRGIYPYGVVDEDEEDED